MCIRAPTPSTRRFPSRDRYLAHTNTAARGRSSRSPHGSLIFKYARRALACNSPPRARATIRGSDFQQRGAARVKLLRALAENPRSASSPSTASPRRRATRAAAAQVDADERALLINRLHHAEDARASGVEFRLASRRASPSHRLQGRAPRRVLGISFFRGAHASRLTRPQVAIRGEAVARIARVRRRRRARARVECCGARARARAHHSAVCPCPRAIASRPTAPPATCSAPSPTVSPALTQSNSRARVTSASVSLRPPAAARSRSVRASGQRWRPSDVAKPMRLVDVLLKLGARFE